MRELARYLDHKARMRGSYNTGVGEFPSKNFVNTDCTPSSIRAGWIEDRRHCPKT